MASAEELETVFADDHTGVSLEVIDACMSLCRRFALSAEELKSHVDSALINTDTNDLTLSLLEGVESDLQRRADRDRRTTPRTGPRTSVPSSHRLPSSNRQATPTFTKECLHGIVDMHATPEMQTQLRDRAAAEATDPTAKRSIDFDALSPASTTDDRHHARKDAGKVEVAFNDHLPLAPPADRSWVTLSSAFATNQTKPYRYMSQTLQQRSDALRQRAGSMFDILVNKYGLARPGAVGQPSQASTVMVGRIACETEHGRMNDKSIVLEGMNGEQAILDVHNLPSFAVFPGQCVAVEGTSADGHVILVQRMYSDAVPPPMKTPREELLAYSYGPNSRPFSVIVAAGPFTTADTLDFRPLIDVIHMVEKAKSDVLILLGPFVDAHHPMIKTGDIEVTFDELFEQILGYCKTMEPTQTILIPSLRDVHHHHVFPQPPFDRAKWTQGGERSKMIFYPNPVTFRINEITVGAVNSDILLQLGAEEASRCAPQERMDRLARLVSHLIHQRSFYPLFPAPAGAQLDFTMCSKLELPGSPDLLLVPSDLRFFCKLVNGTVCINPGRLAKGTLARLSIHPIKEDLDTTIDEHVHRMEERVRVEIVRM